MLRKAVQIRNAVIDERDQLIEIQRRASLENLGDREILLLNPDAVTIPEDQIISGHVYVAECTQVVIAFASVVPKNDRISELDALFVEPAYWRMGIGGILVEHCSDVARLNGSESLHVIGNPHAEKFYLRCGFRPTGVVETRFGNGLLMERQLNPENSGY